MTGNPATIKGGPAKAFALIVCLLLAFGVGGDARAQTIAEKPIKVSLKELIANKDDYNGRLVSVSGFLALVWELQAVFLNDGPRQAGSVDDALWIDLPDTINRNQFKKYSGHIGTITGRFSTKNCNGHLCLFGGEISIDRWSQVFLQK